MHTRGNGILRPKKFSLNNAFERIHECRTTETWLKEPGFAHMYSTCYAWWMVFDEFDCRRENVNADEKANIATAFVSMKMKYELIGFSIAKTWGMKFSPCINAWGEYLQLRTIINFIAFRKFIPDNLMSIEKFWRKFGMILGILEWKFGMILFTFIK